MVKRSDFHIRFAVGNPTEPRSSIWRVWTAKSPKSDVYLAARSLAGTLKVSLHESGIWRSAFVSQNVPRFLHSSEDRSRRLIQEWSRPSELAPGVTLAFRIVVPTSDLTYSPLATSDQNKVVWIPPPAVTHLTEICIFFTAPSVRVPSWPGGQSMGTKLLSSYPLASGETLWLVYLYNEQSYEFNAGLREFKRSLLSTPPRYVRLDLLLRQKNPRLLPARDNDDGSKSFLDLSVSRMFLIKLAIRSLLRIAKYFIRKAVARFANTRTSTVQKRRFCVGGG